MRIPIDTQNFVSGATINDIGEIAFTARVGKNTRNTEWHAIIDVIEGPLEDIGIVYQYGATRIAESGALYSGAIYSGSGSNLPSKWSPAVRSWEPIAPAGAIIVSVSEASSGEEVLIQAPGGTAAGALVYQDLLGTFPIQISSGDAAGITYWNSLSTTLLYQGGISRPDQSGSGHICGSLTSEDEQIPFILTPIPVSP